MINYFEENLEIIKKSVTSLDLEKFEKLVSDSISAMENGNKIIVSGLGKNVPVCDKFVGTMNSLGQAAAFMNTNSAVHGDLGVVHDGDIVIVLTKSGATAESVYLVDLLEKRDCSIWLLTFEKKSVLGERLSNVISLLLEGEGDEWNIVPNNSTTVNLIVLQGLAMEIARRRGVSLSDFKKNHPGGHIGEQLKSV